MEALTSTSACMGMSSTATCRMAPASSSQTTLPCSIPGFSGSLGRTKNVRLSKSARKIVRVSASLASGPQGTDSVPRICSLENFKGEKPQAVAIAQVAPPSVWNNSLLQLLSANVQAAMDVANFEVLSGRMAMVIFFSALVVEGTTGNGVFSGINGEALLAVTAIAVAGAGGAACMVMASRSGEIVSALAAGYKNLVDSAVDSLIDGLFFEQSGMVPWSKKMAEKEQ